MKKLAIVFGFLVLIIASCTSQNSSKDVTVSELVKVINTDHAFQLLDVRTPEEWKEGSIEGAIKINFYDTNFQEQVLEKLNKEQPVYIYCKSGGRSKKATELLASKGFEAYNVLGGYMKWEQNNK